jgi:hypothetical protein
VRAGRAALPLALLLAALGVVAIAAQAAAQPEDDTDENISTWRLHLTETFRPLDYADISDVVLHVRAPLPAQATGLNIFLIDR